MYLGLQVHLTFDQLRIKNFFGCYTLLNYQSPFKPGAFLILNSSFLIDSPAYILY